MKKYSSTDFKEMPWKNGGGITTELYKIQSSDAQTLFRLSMAKISQDGPFSIFPNIKRALIILDGRGVRLTSKHFDLTLNPESDIFYFNGETEINSYLIADSCLDFNVMINQNFGFFEITKTRDIKKIKKENFETFIFFTKEMTLFHFEKNETFFEQDDLDIFSSIPSQDIIIITLRA